MKRTAPLSTSSIDDWIAEYAAWKAHWDAPRPLQDDCDPYRCPVCNAQMQRRPWACPKHGEMSPNYVRSPYDMNLSRRLREEEEKWEPDRDWSDLLDALIAERSKG